MCYTYANLVYLYSVLIASATRLLSSIRTTTTTVAYQLLHDSKEIRIDTWQIKLLIKSITEGLVKTLTEGRNLSDIQLIVTVGFVENLFEFYDISGEGICVLLDIEKAVLGFLDLVRVIVDARELVKNYIIVVDTRRLSVYKLQQNYRLNLTIKIKVDIVELYYNVTNSQSINS